MKQILVVGSANIDLVFNTTSLPRAGETVFGDDMERHFGGKGANQAVAAARLGGAVEFVAVVGNDDHGQEYLKHLAAERIAHEALVVSEERPTGSACIIVDREGRNAIVVAPGANAAALPENLPLLESAIARADIILLQFEIPAVTISRVIELANGLGKTVIVNPSPTRGDFPGPGQRIGYLVVNEIELGDLCGRDTPESEDECMRLAGELSARSKDTVVVTRGGQDTVVVTPEERFTVGVYPVKPIDTVAAGDTFAGGLAVALAEGKKLRDAIAWANAAAGLATTVRGAQTSIPTREQVDVFLTEA